MQLLAISDEVFLKCNGESIFVPLCPSGTVWNDLSKAFFWSDMQGVAGTSFADQSQQQLFFPLSLLISQLQFHLFINYRLWSTIIL
jgi:hypothetical protein